LTGPFLPNKPLNRAFPSTTLVVTVPFLIWDISTCCLDSPEGIVVRTASSSDRVVLTQFRRGCSVLEAVCLN
jgi:hypothetical protein